MTNEQIQQILKFAKHYPGRIDGRIGPKTRAGINEVLENHPETKGWNIDRRRIAAAQVILDEHGCEPGTIGGFDGHNTENACLAYDLQHRAGVPLVIDRSATGTLQGSWPRQDDLERFYGPAGGSEATAGKVILPIPFKIAWNPSQTISRFSCHEKVAGPLTAIFEEAVEHYGEDEFRRLRLDRFGGCFNDRNMRGGSRKSTHAYGIAVVLDPINNQLRWTSRRAKFAKPQYEAFWRIVEKHGGASLGREKNFDLMHFQFARV
ncbi:hypothetical protein [Sulfitobacter sp. W074]|uniref:hypothetical protein n=1 Tax=Sulfitobacter sp. W074 TaxID=2867026 RepID=UPI002882EBF1|nr:hypothetical protein [Sulfitobacter sp. W074]